MHLKFYIYIVGVVTILLCSSGCLNEKIVTGTGTINYIDLEGGFYGIISDDGEKYDPINLPLEFQQDGLNVSFTVRILENQSSIHMWGTLVEIIKINHID